MHENQYETMKERKKMKKGRSLLLCESQTLRRQIEFQIKSVLLDCKCDQRGRQIQKCTRIW